MSRALDKHRIAVKQAQNNVSVFGDASTTSAIADALAELTKGAGQIAAQKQASDEAAKKAAADAAKAAASNADLNAALVDLAAKKKAAAMAHITADQAMAKANAIEADQNGPQHIAARKLQQAAQLADADMQAAQEKVAFFQGGGVGEPPPSGSSKHEHGSAATGMPLWAKIGLGVLGAGTAGFVGYKLVRRKG